MHWWLPKDLELKLLGQSRADLNYRPGFGNEEKKGNYNHCNHDLEALKDNNFLNIKMFPKQTHNPRISSLHQT